MESKRGVFIKKNVNPNNKTTSDCVVRALSVAVEKTWDDIYLDLSSRGFLVKSMPNAKEVWENFLIDNNFIRTPIKVTKGSKRPTVKSFANEHREGTYILQVANHITVCKDGNYIDVWDCGECCLYSYWKKGEGNV